MVTLVMHNIPCLEALFSYLLIATNISVMHKVLIKQATLSTSSLDIQQEYGKQQN